MPAFRDNIAFQLSGAPTTGDDGDQPETTDVKDKCEASGGRNPACLTQDLPFGPLLEAPPDQKQEKLAGAARAASGPMSSIQETIHPRAAAAKGPVI